MDGIHRANRELALWLLGHNYVLTRCRSIEALDHCDFFSQLGAGGGYGFPTVLASEVQATS